MAIDVKAMTDTLFILTGTGSSQSPSGCDAIYFNAFSDIALSDKFSDSSIDLSTADTISPAAISVSTQLLNVKTASSLSKSLYL